MRHFLKETDFDSYTTSKVFSLARDLKLNRFSTPKSLDKQSWGMIFYKQSTRTRVSFEVGLQELGASAVLMDKSATQLGRGESIEDTSKVLSRYLHGLIIRCYSHETLEEFAQQGSIPIVNALSDLLHPCQVFSDMFTMSERWAPKAHDMCKCLKGKKVAFYGDTSSNMANSWLLASAHLGFEVHLAGPEHFKPEAKIFELIKAEGLECNYTFSTDPEAAAKDADVVYTDIWVSMGKEEESKERIKEMRPYTVTQNIINLAKKDAFFMHCLPAHVGEEVTEEVYRGPNSIVIDQAENRLHVQKAILSELVNEW